MRRLEQEVVAIRFGYGQEGYEIRDAGGKRYGGCGSKWTPIYFWLPSAFLLKVNPGPKFTFCASKSFRQIDVFRWRRGRRTLPI